MRGALAALLAGCVAATGIAQTSSDDATLERQIREAIEATDAARRQAFIAAGGLEAVYREAFAIVTPVLVCSRTIAEAHASVAAFWSESVAMAAEDMRARGVGAEETESFMARAMSLEDPAQDWPYRKVVAYCDAAPDWLDRAQYMDLPDVADMVRDALR